MAIIQCLGWSIEWLILSGLMVTIFRNLYRHVVSKLNEAQDISMHLKTLVKPLKVNKMNNSFFNYTEVTSDFSVTGKSRIHRTTTSVSSSDAFALFDLFQQQLLLQASEDHHSNERDL